MKRNLIILHLFFIITYSSFALNDERFLKAKKSDQEYFKRLLERIKLIRTSERMFYQKITDIFAECSIDYDKKK